MGDLIVKILMVACIVFLFLCSILLLVDTLCKMVREREEEEQQ